jgi:hypothetical protein
MQVDLRRLHETWMEVLFPRQLDARETVLGKWTPSSTTGWIFYRTWSALGVPFIALLYPLLLFGYVVRFQSRRLDGTATRIGILGVVVLSVIVWGGLTALARMRFSTGGFIAVLAASLVATLSAVLAVVFHRVWGRKTTVLLAYPFGVTALFLPPVVAALYSPALANVVFPGSTSVAKWLLDNVLTVGGLNTYLRQQYDLRGVAYVGMWFGLAVPVGWFLGILVTLADLVRPTEVESGGRTNASD